MATKSLTIRELAKQLLDCENIDQPVSAININDSGDEFEGESGPMAFETVTVSDNTDEGGDAVIYFLGPMPEVEDEIDS